MTTDDTDPVAQQLLPCPFCGEATRGVIEDHHPRAGKGYHIGCGNRRCEMQPETMVYKNPEAAIAAWNSRPSYHAMKEALEWIVEDGASDARAVECARAALGNQVKT